MEQKQLLELIEKVSDSSLTDFFYETGELKLRMKKAKKKVLFTGNCEEAETLAERKAGQAEPSGGKEMKSPLVGTFYGSPSPESEPFVKEGDVVKKGQTLGIIEAMKLMNEIVCEYDGILEKALVSDGDMVEYGQPLFVIQERGGL